MFCVCGCSCVSRVEKIEIMFLFSSNLSSLSRSLSNSLCVISRSFSSDRLIRLGNLTPNPKAFKVRKRVGRGPGSGLGKTSGRGHQFSRSTPRSFEGGQTPLYKLFPKIGFHNHTLLSLSFSFLSFSFLSFSLLL